ncbi:luciferin 4-monooxygenase-like [Chironomus tepperi]|uniref:luciferin 4-monooxygenase-like n=1 Tax=Chironomus tepperi TaxID=113505 RepID=UPI00391F494A
MSNNPNIIYGGDFEETLDYPTVGALLYDNFKDGGDKVALIDGIKEQQWTYNNILEQSVKVAKALYGAGIRQNDVITVLSENRLEYAAIAYGTLFLNAICAPANYGYTERELEHTLNITKPKFVFISSSAKEIAPKLKQFNYVKRVILLDDDNVDTENFISYKTFINKFGSNNFDVERFVRQPVKLFEQVAAIFMSSGTTGLPKGVELTHGNLIACIASNLERVPLGKALFGDVTALFITPWFHVMGFMGKLLFTTSREFTQVFLSKFIPTLYLKSIEKYKVLTISVPPPVVLFLAKTPLLSNYDLTSLKIVFSGAAPLTKELEEEVKKRFNDDIIVLQAYGQTEATLGVLYSDAATAKPGSVGQLIKGTYGKVIDLNGNILGPHQVGELCFKGPFIMKGYIDNIEATSSTIDKDGWLHTGDLGYYDEDFQFFIVDRLKELIKYKGYQVPPAELEGLLMSHPKVRDAGVIGIPDEIAGELPMAFVVKEEGSDITEQEVKDYVAKNASNPKWLRGGVKFIDAIPKNITGKILRREMKELYKSLKSKL